MKTALRLLLAPYRFSVDRLFRMGEVGWAHWFDDPNRLYRRRNRLTYTGFSGATSGTPGTAPTGGWVFGSSGGSQTVSGGSVTFTVAGLARQFFYTPTAAATLAAGESAVFTVTVEAVSITAGSPVVAYLAVTSGSASAQTYVQASQGAGRHTCYVTAGSAGCTVEARLGVGVSANATGTLTVKDPQVETRTLTATEYQDVPTTWAQAYLAAVGAENIFAWTDNAGTTPVTAVGDTIGLSLDRAYGGMRGPELVSNGEFDSDTAWNKGTGWAISGGKASITGAAVNSDLGQVISVVDGRSYEIAFNIDSISANGRIYLLDPFFNSTPITTTGAKRLIVVSDSGRPNNITIRALSSDGLSMTAVIDNISVREIPGTHLIQATGTARPTLSARVNLLLNTATMSTQNVTTIAASYKLSFTGTGTVTLSGTSTDGPLVGTGANDRVSLTFTPTAGTLTLTVSGSVTLADLRTADDAAKNIPAYQRVGATAADHDTDGFPHGQYPDGTDDNQTTTTGGGGTTGFFYCGAITVSGGAGTARTIWSDTGTNTGYRVRINSSNKLELAAGNGSAYTTVASNETITAPGTYILSAWDDGGVLAVQVNNFAAATTTRPGVSAGTSTATMYKDNGAASSYLNGRDYGSVYRQSYIGESQHTRLKRWLADRARITL